MENFKFSIKLIPTTKERPWEYKRVNAGRIKKTCNKCGRDIPIGQPAINFTLRTTIGNKHKFLTRYAHTGYCAGQVASLMEVFSTVEILKISEL